MNNETNTQRQEPEEVKVHQLVKTYGKHKAIDQVSFTAQAGKLTTLLGPSGCGKTTTLRAIGGFITVDSGTITIGSTTIDTLPPYKRPTRTVFQSYALFPHMTVYENVAFGLKATKTPKQEIPSRVEHALKMVGLESFAQRQSGQLSGGQQQRVAFARALVTKPQVLLLDEPLSNLDAKLRVQMRLEIRKLQQEVGITTIYVTHDQEEAMSLSDHVIVMNQGRIEQQGPPHEIYEQPVNSFVADFIGVSNTLPVTIQEVSDHQVQLNGLGNTIAIPLSCLRFNPQPNQPCKLVARPEHFTLEKSNQTITEMNKGKFQGSVVACDYRGSAADYIVQLVSGEQLTVEVASPRGDQLINPGTEVMCSLDLTRVSLIP